MTIIKPNQIKFDLEGKNYNSGKDHDMAMITLSNIDGFDLDYARRIGVNQVNHMI